MKKILRMLTILTICFFAFAMFSNYYTTTVSAEGEEEMIVVSEKRPYLFVNAGEAIDLSTIGFKGSMGEMMLTDGTYSELSSQLTIESGSLVASEKGIFSFVFTTTDDVQIIHVFAKLTDETSYVVYSMSFDAIADGDIPADYTLVKGSSSISGGYLLLTSPGTSTPTQVTLPDYLGGLKNYVIETDFVMSSAIEPTRWASVMFRWSLDNYFQMAIRQNATATNGVEFAKAINGQWNVPLTTSYTEAIDPAKVYRLKIDLMGSVVNEYINDDLLITYENASDYADGKIGFQSSGSDAKFNNILITVPESYIDYSAIDYSAIPAVYTPESNVILPPGAVKYMDSFEDIEALRNEVRPQTAVFRINSNLDVTMASGVPICNIIDIFEYIDGNVIPAFYTKNHDVAVSIASLLKTYGVRDVFLISPNDDAIMGAREEYNMIRGVYEVTYDSSKATLSDSDLLQIRNESNGCGAIVALLPIQYVNQENVYYLQERLVSVWANTFGLTSLEVSTALISGVNGIILNDYVAFYDSLMLFPVNTLLRRPMVIGHRGLPTEAPENTLNSMELAMSVGVDVVELDIYLTTDNEIVAIHDSTTVRTTNGTLNVEESSLEQLRALEILDSFEIEEAMQIPTLREYFERIQGTDTILFIEIKSSKPEIITALKNLIDEFGVSSQIVIISFNAGQISVMHEVLPEISTGYLSTALVSSANLESSIRATLNAIVPIRATMNPEQTPLTEEFIVQMNYRGLSVWPWTVDTSESYYKFYLWGVGGITSNYSRMLSGEFNRFYVAQTEYVYDLYQPQSFSIRGKIGMQDGFEYTYIPALQVLGDTGTNLVMGDNATVLSADTVGDVYLVGSFTTTLLNGETVTLYSNVLHISVIDTTPAPEPEPEPEPEPLPEPEPEPEPEPLPVVDDGISVGWLVGGITGGVGAITGLIFLGLRFFKKPKI